MTHDRRQTGWWQTIFLSVLLGCVAFVVSAARINHGLVNSHLWPGPGLTLDESFNISQGIYLVESLGNAGWLVCDPVTLSRIFDEDNGHLPDHPPLGRMLLGMAHVAFSGWEHDQPQVLFSVLAARLGSSLMFAIMVSLLVGFVCRTEHWLAGLVTALLIIGMPRLLGHSRIASLETATNLFWVAACLPLLAWWTDSRPPTTRQAQISGVLWGLLLLTKVQGIFLPPVLVLWAVGRFRLRSCGPLCWWFGCAGVIFFIGWPWLWDAPIAHTWQYLGRTTVRIPLNTWHWGIRFIDKQVPWHYPLLLTVVTLPLVTMGGLLQCVRFCRQFDSTDCLLLSFSAFPLFVFSIPGVPVYDGTRLFLICFPWLAVLAARGFYRLTVSFELNRRKYVCGAIVGALALGFAAVNATGKHRLMQYNLLGKLFAESSEREADYWAASLNGEFWKQVPQNSTVYVAPVLHQNQLAALQHLVPEIIARNIQLKAFQYRTDQKGLLLLIHRYADLRPVLRHPPEGASVIAEVADGDIIYARLLDTSNAQWTEIPDWPDE